MKILGKSWKKTLVSVALGSACGIGMALVVSKIPKVNEIPFVQPVASAGVGYLVGGVAGLAGGAIAGGVIDMIGSKSGATNSAYA